MAELAKGALFKILISRAVMTEKLPGWRLRADNNARSPMSSLLIADQFKCQFTEMFTATSGKIVIEDDEDLLAPTQHLYNKIYLCYT